MVVVMVMRAVYGIAVLVRELLRMLIVVMVVMMVLLGAFKNLDQDLALQILLTLDGLQNHFSVQLCKRRCDDRRLLVVLANQRDRLINLLLRSLVGARQNDGAGILNLVDKELAEILKINSRLRRIHNRHCTAQLHVRNLCSGLLDGTHHIVELADAGGLDQNALRLIGLHNLLQRGVEIAHQRAADAARIHLTDLNAGFL